jgi:hypothetical protein
MFQDPSMDIFTSAQWRAAGRSRRTLTQAVKDGEIRRVVHRVYAWCDVPDVPETRAQAIQLVRPGTTVVGHTTAAWLSDVDVLPPGRSIADEPIRLIVPTDDVHPRIPGCRASQADLPESDLVEEYGVLRTSDLRTALDLGRFAPRPLAVASLDAFLNRERVALRDLWARARLLVNVRNCRILRSNLAAADAGSQSPAESMQRVLFVDAGLPRPKTQVPVKTSGGELLGFLDMGWVRYLLGSEYDGVEFHDEDEDRAADERRRLRIETETPWTVDVARKEQLFGQPAALVAHTAQLLLARGWTPANPLVLDQITRAAEYEASTGERWKWLPPERLRGA